MDFTRDCERWRIWAQTNLAGAAVQLASAGDAAALTVLLGSPNEADAIVAAQAAAGLNFEKAPLSTAWAKTGYSIQAPDITFERLAQAGWEPVPQSGHRVDAHHKLAPNVRCFATWTAERVIGKLETVEVKSVAARVGEEIGFWAPDSLIGGLIGEAVLGGIGAAISGGTRSEIKRVWKNTGRFHFFITHDGMFFMDRDKPAHHRYAEFMAMQFAPTPRECVQVLVKDKVVIQFQGPYARLMSLVLDKQYWKYWTGRLSEHGLAQKAAADAKDPVSSPRDALILAKWYRDAGFLQGAIEYFEIATIASDPTLRSEGFFALGKLWLDQGDLTRARDCYMRATESGNLSIKAQSLINISVIERKLGRPDAAVTALNRAIETNHADYGPDSMWRLGVVYENDLNDLVKAQQSYQRAIDSGHPGSMLDASYSCGMLLRKQGDNAGAVTMLHRVATSGHKDWEPRAKYWLAIWYGQDWKDPVTGHRLLDEVVATGHPEWAPKARELLKQKPYAGFATRS